LDSLSLMGSVVMCTWEGIAKLEVMVCLLGPLGYL